MSYSLIGILALILLFVVNYDVLFRSARRQVMRSFWSYRAFLYCVAAFLVSDIFWGFFDQAGMDMAAYVDTGIYFLAMSCTVLTWMRFAVSYMQGKALPKRILLGLGWTMFTAGVVSVIINFFQPILFAYDVNTYVPKSGRYIFLGVQIIAFGLTSVYTLLQAIFAKSREVRGRYLAITSFGVVLAFSIGFQIYHPLQPFYAIGCCIGITIIRAFLITSENAEYRMAIQEGKTREDAQKKELGFAKHLAYTDPLTGLKNKHAYVEDEDAMDVLIRDGKMGDFAVVVFDLNDLKLINDTHGHDAGDALIRASAKLIQEYFPVPALYRFGGDEFAAVLTDEAFAKRVDTLHAFNERIAKNVGTEEPVIATGMSEFRLGEDNTFSAVFARADEAMYWKKRKLKQNSNNPRYSSRMDVYEMFYHNKDCSLIDMLNNSPCDEIIEVNLKKDSMRQFYHIEGKYIAPGEDAKTWADVYKFCCEELVHPDDREIYERVLNSDRFFQRLEKNSIPNFECMHIRFRVQDGSYRYVEQCVIAGEENELAPDTFRLYIFDIHNLMIRKEGKESVREGSYEKERNPMTGLLTESAFFPQAEALIAKKPEIEWCLVTVDIEHFRFFDEWYGRAKGDELLANIGKILLEEEKSVGGLAGYFSFDDFAILCPHDEDRIEALYERVRDVVISFGLSVGFLPAFGVARIEDGLRVVDALDHANIALGRAKRDIRNRISTYDVHLRDSEESQFHILSEFVEGMKNDEFTFYLQPQCAISSGGIVGSEALTRWVKKSGRIVPPKEYIPLLEKYGFIMDLDQKLWEKVAQWLRSLMDQGIAPLPVSVNVSRADIFTLDIAKIFHGLAEKYKLPHSLLKIEITESAYTETTTQIDKLVKKLRQDGFMVLMDDFGSGYSSLNMLNTLEVDVIKLDGDFLRWSGLAYERGIRIIESVVNMAKNLALPIVVEGVETKSQAEFLQSLGCRYAQGYYYFKPMPIKDFEKLLRDEKKLDRRGFEAKRNEQFRLREFLDENIYSDSMLNNILGPVAFYALHENGDVDIVRFNEQFYEAVGVKEFQQRLTAIQRFVPEEERKEFLGALHRAMEDKLAGASSIQRFAKPDGTYLSFRIHFYHIGKKESAELFYGSARNVTKTVELEDELRLISHYSSDSFIFVSRVGDHWQYRVASHGLSSLIELTPEQLEQEMNDGRFAKRVSRKDNLQGFMVEVEQNAKAKKNFTHDFHIRGKKGKNVPVRLEFTYVGDSSNSVLYILRASVADAKASD